MQNKSSIGSIIENKRYAASTILLINTCDDVSDSCFFPLSFLNKSQAQEFGHLEGDMCPNL